MPLCFFDINDGKFTLDEEGTECADLEAVRREAKRVLPAIAKEVLPKDGDNQNLIVRARDERHETVYTATLIYINTTMPERLVD